MQTAAPHEFTVLNQDRGSTLAGVELPGGTILRSRTAVGDRLQFTPSNAPDE